MSLIDPIITIHRDASDIPEKVWDTYPRYWSKNLGEPMGVLFPLFGNAFPKTTLAMERCWSRPVLRSTIRSWEKRCLCDVHCSQGNKTLFMNPSTRKEEILLGEIFDEGTEMLPPRWKELYRWFDSFYIAEGQEFQSYWINTPFAFAKRVDANEYVQKSGTDKFSAKALETFTGSPPAQIMCWLYTDAGDALFLDESRKDHKVYHINKGDHNDIAVLNQPEDVLDDYLAHYVAGGAPKDFSFR